MAERLSKVRNIPGFTAQNSLVQDYQFFEPLMRHYSYSTISALITPAVIRQPCYDNCVADCPPGGPQHKICVQGCVKDCSYSCSPSCGPCLFTHELSPPCWRNCTRDDCTGYQTGCDCSHSIPA